MPGAGGSCAGKWEAIRVLHSISHGRGPITDQTRAAPRSVSSWCSAITWGKLWATKMVSGLFKVAMTCTPCGPGPDPSQAQSHSGAPKPDGRVDPGFHGALARSQASRPRGQERLRSSCPNPCSPRTRSPCGPADRNPFSSSPYESRRCSWFLLIVRQSHAGRLRSPHAEAGRFKTELPGPVGRLVLDFVHANRIFEDHLVRPLEVKEARA